MGNLSKSKKFILLFATLGSIFSLLNFALAGRTDGIITTVIIFIRCFVFNFKDKFKTDKIAWLFIIIHTIAGLVSFKDMLSVVTLLTPVITTYYYWFGTAKEIKYAGIMVNSMWLFYYFCTGLYLTAANTGVGILLSLIAIIRIKLEEKNDENT